MTNSINDAGRNRSDVASSQSNKTTKTNAVAPASSENNNTNNVSTEDTVSITSEASRILELQNSLTDAPDIDLEKVEAIKQEIADGNYPIDHERIASNLIDLEKILS